MIFTYWYSDPEDSDAPICPDSVTAWRQQYPDMVLFSQENAIDALNEFGADNVELFKRIRLPACQSDIARLVLLYRFGGLYVDSHTGPGAPRGLLNIFEKLSTYETVVFEKSWELDNENRARLINGVICSRQYSPVVKILVESALQNLQNQEDREFKSNDFVPYNLVVLSGAWNIRVNLFDASQQKTVLKRDYSKSVCVIPLQKTPEDGILLYKYYGYRKTGRHWSERQKQEGLFTSRPST